jgi:hypothetical protein
MYINTIKYVVLNFKTDLYYKNRGSLYNQSKYKGDYFLLSIKHSVKFITESRKCKQYFLSLEE